MHSLVGLYFVHCECGPTAGVVAGFANKETAILRVLSGVEEEVWYVPVGRVLGWDLYGTEREALVGFRGVCEDATKGLT